MNTMFSGKMGEFTSGLLKIFFLDIRADLEVPLGRVMIPASSEPFIAKRAFRRISRNGKTIIGASRDFLSWFEDKVEAPMAKTSLCYATLLQPVVSVFMFRKMVRQHRSETSLREIFFLMESMKSGKPEPLIGSHTNIFFVRDATNMLRAVHLALSRGGSWSISAFSIGDPDLWRCGRMFFRSRLS